MSRSANQQPSLAEKIRQRLVREVGAVRDAALHSPWIRTVVGELARAPAESHPILTPVANLLSLRQLRGLAELLDVTPCSVTVAGPTNVGKSTLLNALAGRKVAAVGARPGTTREVAAYQSLGFTLQDTPGADELGGDELRHAALTAVEQAEVVILLFDASRGIAASEHDLFQQVVERRRRRSESSTEGSQPSLDERQLIVALNKIDAVPRGEVDQVTRQAAANLGLPRSQLLVLSALKRRGLDLLVRRLVDAAPSMTEALAAVMPQYTEQLAHQLIFRYAAAAATIAFVPLPTPAVMPLTALQLVLVLRLARLYGYQLDWHRLREVGPTLAAGVGWRELFRLLARVIPVTGWLLNSGVAYAGTYATGRAAQHFFGTGQQPTRRQILGWREEGHQRQKDQSPSSVPQPP